MRDPRNEVELTLVSQHSNLTTKCDRKGGHKAGCSGMISKCHKSTERDSYHELKEMDSASDASEPPPLYHGLIRYDQCLHGTLPRKIQATLSIPNY